MENWRKRGGKLVENRRKEEEEEEERKKKKAEKKDKGKDTKTDKREAESKMGRDEELRRERCSNFMNNANITTNKTQKK